MDYELRAIGDQWQSDAHVLIVLAGDGDGRDYAVAHPTGCTDDDCIVTFQLYEGWMRTAARLSADPHRCRHVPDPGRVGEGRLGDR